MIYLRYKLRYLPGRLLLLFQTMDINFISWKTSFPSLVPLTTELLSVWLHECEWRYVIVRCNICLVISFSAFVWLFFCIFAFSSFLINFKLIWMFCLFSNVGIFNGQIPFSFTLRCSIFDCLKFICYTITFQMYDMCVRVLCLQFLTYRTYFSENIISYSFHLHEDENTIMQHTRITLTFGFSSTNVYVFTEIYWNIISCSKCRIDSNLEVLTLVPSTLNEHSMNMMRKSTSLLLSYQCVLYAVYFMHTYTKSKSREPSVSSGKIGVWCHICTKWICSYSEF